MERGEVDVKVSRRVRRVRGRRRGVALYSICKGRGGGDGGGFVPPLRQVSDDD